MALGKGQRSFLLKGYLCPSVSGDMIYGVDPGIASSSSLSVSGYFQAAGDITRKVTKTTCYSSSMKHDLRQIERKNCKAKYEGYGCEFQ